MFQVNDRRSVFELINAFPCPWVLALESGEMRFKRCHNCGCTKKISFSRRAVKIHHC